MRGLLIELAALFLTLLSGFLESRAEHKRTYDKILEFFSHPVEIF